MNAENRLSLSALSSETAVGKARTVLDKAVKQTGFLPNMYARMANSPGLLGAYLDAYAAFRSESGFTPAEQEVIFMVISRENGCEYCVAAHSTLADKMSKVPTPVTDAIRALRPVPDAKLSALATFVEVMVRTRGLPSRSAVEAFLAAGYVERQVLEVVLAISVKILSNYANHLFHTPVDSMFEARRWSAVQRA